MFVHTVKFFMSVNQIGNQRKKFQHKICFKNDRYPLRLKSSPAQSVATRLFKDGKLLKMYFNCQKFYLNYVLPRIHKLPPNNEFKNFYYYHQSFKDLNRVLFWKIMGVNPMFNLKKIKNRKLLYYLKSDRRNVLVLRWLKYIIKVNKKNYNNNTEMLFKPMFVFISTQKEVNEIYKLKLKLYKMRLLRG